MERRLPVSVETVLTALTSSEAVGRWFGPSDDFQVTVHEWDCRIGGRYRVEFKSPADESHIVAGEFKTLVPNRTVAYSWSWEGQPPMDMLVTFQLEEAGDHVRLLFRHQGFPVEDVRDHHDQGWLGTLDRLEREVRG
jgi:uncharacterized protein YndB with AHSA1/START domain